jgi:hypothetical protein
MKAKLIRFPVTVLTALALAFALAPAINLLVAGIVTHDAILNGSLAMALLSLGCVALGVGLLARSLTGVAFDLIDGRWLINR